MRFLATIGWSIYALGSFFERLVGSAEAYIFNLLYDIADFVNKIAFFLATWACAKFSTLEGAK